MVIGWVVVAAVPAYSADRQQRFTIAHATDTATGKASWAVTNDGAALPKGFGDPLGWHRGELPYIDGKRWIAPAASIADLRAPQLELTGKAVHGKSRTVTFRLRPNGAESVSLIADKDAGILSGGTGGYVRPIDPDATGKYYLQCYGRSCDGAVIQFTTTFAKSLTMTLVGSRRGLPATAHALMEQRPKFARPQYSPDATLTISRIRL